METMTGFLFLKDLKNSRSVYFGMEIEVNIKPSLQEGQASPFLQAGSVGLAWFIGGVSLDVWVSFKQ